MGTALAVLLFVLKIIGILLLVVLALVIVVLLTPVGVELLWEPSRYSLHARFGPIRYLLMPREEKEKATKPSKPKKSDKNQNKKQKENSAEKEQGRQPGAKPSATPAAQTTSNGQVTQASLTPDEKKANRAAQEQPDLSETHEEKPEPLSTLKQEAKPLKMPEGKQSPKQKQKEEESGLLDDIKDSLGAVLNELRDDPLGTIQRLLDEFGPMAGGLLHSVHISHLCVLWTIAGEDAAQTAIAYGKAMTVSNIVLERVQELVKVQADSLRIEPDFTNQMAEMRHLSCQITVRPCIILIIGIKLLWRYLQVRKNKNTTRT